MNAQQQRELDRGLRALADSTREMNASGHVEDAMLARMGRLKPAPTDVMVPAPTGSRLSTTSLWGPASAGLRRLLPLAAALILAVGGALWSARSTPARLAIHPSGFVALPGAAWLPEMESATIVRVSLPVTALPAYGVAIQPDLTSDAVLAELLVAQDGQARAIRFVNDSD
jgi:hypothetical protein